MSGQFFTSQLLLMRSPSAVYKTSSLPNRTMKDLCGATKASDQLHSFHLLLNFLVKTHQKQNCVFSWGQATNKETHLLCFRVSLTLYRFWSPHTGTSDSVSAASFAFEIMYISPLHRFVGYFFPVFHLQYFSPTYVCLSCNKHMVIHNSLCYFVIKIIDLVLNVHENTCFQTNYRFSYFYWKQRQ